MTTIAVLGAGNVGSTLARKWASAGHVVVLGTRDPANPRLRGLADEIGASTAAHAEAVTGAEVVVFALPADAMPGIVETHGGALDAKIVIDATNNLAGPEMNSIAAIRAAAPGAAVARAFNSLGWENLADPDFGGTTADLLWCGPDGERGATVEQLITDIGLRAVRVGGLEQIEVVDMLARLWFALVLGQGNRHLAFKVLTR